MVDYSNISLFFLIFFSFVFFYLDLKYQKIPNIVSFLGIILFIIIWFLSGFFEVEWLFFIFRTIILSLVFYFFYLQWRLAWWDFKLYFVITGFLLTFLYTQKNIIINWWYFDMYIIFYSLLVGFIYLLLRYIFLYIKWWFKLNIDPMIKIKLSNDRKDAILHFILFSRSLIYFIFYYFLENNISNSSILFFIIIILEFTFMWWFLTFLKEKVFLYLDWFVRKKEVKWFSIIFYLFSAFVFIYLKYYVLVFLLIIFTFLDYILAVLQLNFDTKIVNTKDLTWNEKLSIRNFPIKISKFFDLNQEIEIDEETYKYIKNKDRVEIITEVSYGIFLIIWIYIFLYNNFILTSF